MIQKMPLRKTAKVCKAADRRGDGRRPLRSTKAERPASIQHSALTPPPRDHLASVRVAPEQLDDEAKPVLSLDVRTTVHGKNPITPRHDRRRQSQSAPNISWCHWNMSSYDLARARNSVANRKYPSFSTASA